MITATTGTTIDIILRVDRELVEEARKMLEVVVGCPEGCPVG